MTEEALWPMKLLGLVSSFMKNGSGVNSGTQFHEKKSHAGLESGKAKGKWDIFGRCETHILGKRLLRRTIAESTATPS